MRKLLCSAVVLALVGCSEAPAGDTVKAQRKAARIEAAEQALGKTPALRSYRYDAGQLLVVEVPFRDNDGFIETQRCLLWRDAEYKTSSLQCPGGSVEALPDIQ